MEGLRNQDLRGSTISIAWHDVVGSDLAHNYSPALSEEYVYEHENAAVDIGITAACKRRRVLVRMSQDVDSIHTSSIAKNAVLIELFIGSCEREIKKASEICGNGCERQTHSVTVI